MMIDVASVEPGQAIIFNASRSIYCLKVTTTLFFQLDVLLYNVSDQPIDQTTGEAMTIVTTEDYFRNQHQEGALTMGASNLYLSPREYNAVSSGNIVQWSVSVAKFQPTVSDNQSSFKFVRVSIPEEDAEHFMLKKKG